MVIVSFTYRVVNVRHLQKVLGAAVLLHLYGLPAPFHGYSAVLLEICIWGHLHVSTPEDDFVDVVFVPPKR